MKSILLAAVLLLPPASLNYATYIQEDIKVAVIDTGLDLSDHRFKDKLCKTGHVSFSGPINDVNGHGTHIAGLIMKYGPRRGYCLMIIKYYEDKNNGKMNLARSTLAFRHAIRNGATIINFSGGGPVSSEEEANIFLNNPHIKFVVAAGNKGEDISQIPYKYYPASYDLPNIISVGALVSPNSNKTKKSNYGSTVDAWEIGQDVMSLLPSGTCWHKGTLNCKGKMSGTSQATAITTGKILRSLVK